jgi:hypothetical protein
VAEHEAQRERRPLARPPAAGALKRQADAQAPALRAELSLLMQLDGLTAQQVAEQANLDAATLSAFLAGASINPRWQARLARWIARASNLTD